MTMSVGKEITDSAMHVISTALVVALTLLVVAGFLVTVLVSVLIHPLRWIDYVKAQLRKEPL